MTSIPGYGDLPATEDELGFAPAATALAAIVNQTERSDTPLTIGVYGPWGSGKTSLMQMVLDKLDSRAVTVWFEAWRYAQQDSLWRALLLSVVDSLRTLVEYDSAWLTDYSKHQQRLKPQSEAQGFEATREALNRRLDDLAASLYRSVDREEQGSIEFQWGEAGKLAAGTVIRAGFSYIPVIGQIAKAVEKAGEALGEEAYADKLFDLFQRRRTHIYHEHVRSLEQFHQDLKRTIGDFITALDRRLVIFIDDLDRCLPDDAIGVLEALKVFLNVEGCVVVLGIDREIIERGIRVRYKEFALSSTLPVGSFPVTERDYLEKIVQVPFTLPPLAPHSITTFLQKRLPSVEGLSDEERTQVALLMTTGLLRNPRKVKRSFNIFRLQLNLDRAYGRSTAAGLIAKLTVIQSSFADLYEQIARDPLVLRQIEQVIRGTPGTSSVPQHLRDEIGKADARLKEMLYLTPFFEGLSDDMLRALVYQSRITSDDT